MAKRKRKMALVTEAVGYLRVSTQDQADSGLSMEAQRARIEAQAQANGWVLVDVCTDAGLSAQTLERPGLQAALGALRPGRVLLAAKLDRLTRSVADLFALDAAVSDRGAEWATVQERIDTTTATGRMMRTLIASVAEWEREVIAERTSAALRAKRVRGERIGTTPLGFVTEHREDGSTHILRHEEEQRTVEMARQWRSEGLPLREIASRLTQAGRQTKRRGRWEAATVQGLLKTRYLETLLPEVPDRESG